MFDTNRLQQLKLLSSFKLQSKPTNESQQLVGGKEGNMGASKMTEGRWELRNLLVVVEGRWEPGNPPTSCNDSLVVVEGREELGNPLVYCYWHWNVVVMVMAKGGLEHRQGWVMR